LSDRTVQHDTLVIDRTFDADPTRVFAAWASPHVNCLSVQLPEATSPSSPRSLTSTVIKSRSRSLVRRSGSRPSCSPQKAEELNGGESIVAELFLQISVSLDGYIEDRDRDIEWMTSDTSFDAVATATLKSIDGMIFGRRAHALLAGFWPTAGNAPQASLDLIEQAKLMNTLPKYVLTHNEERTGWSNSHPISVDDVLTLKQESVRPIAVFAGAKAAQALLEQDLIDEVRLIQYPVLLGGGTPLFADDGKRRNLRLTASERFESGAMLNRYRFG
jgi:dihydrofolate reductase